MNYLRPEKNYLLWNQTRYWPEIRHSISFMITLYSNVNIFEFKMHLDLLENLEHCFGPVCVTSAEGPTPLFFVSKLLRKSHLK